MTQIASNLSDLHTLANAAGVDKNDLYLLGLARDMNSFLKTDCEAIIFGLLKMGMEPRVSALLTMPEQTLRKKTEIAVKNKIIPNTLDTDFQVFMLNIKRNAIVVKEYALLFDDCSDTDIIALKNNAEQKLRVIRALVDYVFSNKVINEDFFTELYTNPGAVTAISKDNLKKFFIYRDVCYGNNKFLSKFVVSNKLQHVDFLFRLDKAGILAKIDSGVLNSSSVPQNITADEYASYIYEQIQKQHGTRSLMLHLSRVSAQSINCFNVQGVSGNLFDVFKAFLVKDNTISDHSNKLSESTIYAQEDGVSITRSFDFAKDVARDYMEMVSANGNNTSFVNALEASVLTKGGFVRILAAVQRVQSLIYEGDRNQIIISLLKAGFTSAYSIVKAGQSTFVTGMNIQIDNSGIWNKVYSAAEHKVNSALALLSNYSSATNSSNPQVVRDKKPGEENGLGILKIAELSDLFGAQDVNDVKECESVLGPAAYLVDLLDLLKQIENEYGGAVEKNLYEILIKRRPDLELIPLNCANALTRVPYIDLVIEILEQAVYGLSNNGMVYIPSQDKPLRWNTSKTEAELVAEPEHCIEDIYSTSEIKNFFSWKQPNFDFITERNRVYARAAGINLAQWMEITQKDEELIQESLGFSQVDLRCFQDVIPNTEKGVILDGAFIHKSDNNCYDIKVKPFLEYTGLSLQEVNQLMDSWIVNPLIIPDGASEAYRYSMHFRDKMELSTAYWEFVTEGIAEAFVIRMFQYRRLLQATCWSVPVLDAVLLSVDNNGIPLVNRDVVEIIAKIKAAQMKYALSNEQVAGLFGGNLLFEYKYNTSYFQWLFMDNGYPAQFKELAQKLLSFETVSHDLIGLPVLTSDKLLHPFIEYLIDVLNISEDKFRDMISGNLISESGLISADLVRNLVKAGFLMNALKVGVEELLAYRLRLENPTISYNIDNVLDVLSSIKLAQTVGCSFAALQNAGFTDANVNQFVDMLGNLLGLLRASSNEVGMESEIISNELSTVLNVDKALVDVLVNNYPSSGQNFVELLKASSENSTPASEDLDHLKRIANALVFAKATGFSKGMLEDYMLNRQAGSFDIFDMNALDLEELKLFFRLKSLVSYLKDSDKIFSLNALLTSGALNAISALFRFNEMLDGAIELPLFPVGKEGRLKWLMEFTVLTSKGVVVQNNCLPGGTNMQLINGFDSLREAAIVSLGKNTFTSLITSFRNILRVKQRDFLVNFYISKVEGLENTNDVFSYLLIDTQMTPAVSSSRIVQATLTIQLLIQRVQFNLEKDVVLSRTDENRWKWMSLYRVWEANRRIFLYPENWLEPELRDDKSPFFKDLEKELSGTPVNDEVVEQVYGRYLDDFEKISNVQYCQMFNEEKGSSNVLHVVGRTPDFPYNYYYRKLINETYWTPWEKMAVSINSEHLLPLVVNDRLFVFWLEFLEEVYLENQAGEQQQGENSSSGSSEEETPSRKPSRRETTLEKPGRTPARRGSDESIHKSRWVVRVFHSEYKNRKWSERKTHNAEVVIPADSDEQLVDKSLIRFVFRDNPDGFALLIQDTSKSKVYQLNLEVFNQPHIYMVDSLQDVNKNIWRPEGTLNHYQKVIDEGGEVFLPINGRTGQPSTMEIVDIDAEDVSLKRRGSVNMRPAIVYPHQFENFACQTPFVIEYGYTSFVCMPASRKSKQNSASSQIRGVLEQIDTDFMVAPSLADAGSLPEFFTDDNQDATILEDQSFLTSVPVDEGLSDQKIRNNVSSSKNGLLVYMGYHPYVNLLRRNVQRYGVEGMLAPERFFNSAHFTPSQDSLLPGQSNFRLLEPFKFNSSLVLNGVLSQDERYKHIAEAFEFDLKGATGLYNWELFFHIPFMIANRFYSQGLFDEALKWMHYIFDPREMNAREGGGKEYFSHFWKFRPFALHNETSGLEDVLFNVLSQKPDLDGADAFHSQLEVWSNDPFKPHAVARMRISAYMKATVMRYLDILIARGDQSFRVDTLESVNEALQYYVIAAQILGRKPEVLQTSIMDPKTYKEFNSGGMANALEYIEEPFIKPENEAYLEHFIVSGELGMSSIPASGDKDHKNMIQDLFARMHETEKVYKLYFGIPKNEKMFGYWDLVSDRLFKIRNSLNLDGVFRTQDLFAPPIDPGMLAHAAALGLNIKALVNGQDGPESHYRFSYMLNQALTLCGELKSLGAQLLSAYEKGDNEMISNLRAHHEIVLSENVTRIREKAIEEADQQIKALLKQQIMIGSRKQYYGSRKKTSKLEDDQLKLLNDAHGFQSMAQAIQFEASLVAMIPQFRIGFTAFLPSMDSELGGEQLSRLINVYASVYSFLSSQSSFMASKTGMMANYERRKEDWDFQKEMAEKELDQLEVQKVSANIRRQMAGYEIDNHLKQLEISRKTYEVLQTKYTNEQLYLWLRIEIGKLHSKAYDMAYKLAKQAEKAYNFELNPDEMKRFVSSSHFDTKYEGLLAGERLYQDLKNMEMSYLENNKRRFEITKHISLALLNPMQIINLRKDGHCVISIPELLFDMDHPGHCNRRIKSISLSIPCVTGPYTSVSASLILKSSKIKPKNGDSTDINLPPIEAMATSSAVNDSGLFQLNFNDERYLPFEGAGVDSVWALSLPAEVRQFDYNTIADVVISIQYTAEDGGTITEDIKSKISTMISANGFYTLLIDVKGQFPQVFETLKTSNANIEIKRDMLPWFLQDSKFTISQIGVSRFDDNELKSDPPLVLPDFGTAGLTKFDSTNIPGSMFLLVKLTVQ